MFKPVNKNKNLSDDFLWGTFMDFVGLVLVEASADQFI